MRALSLSLSVLCVLTAARPAAAQSLVTQLGTLLTEQRPTAPAFVPDTTAAAATAATVAGLLSVELSTLPLATSSGGFVYRLNPSLGLVERASDGFGPFFSERLLRNGRRQTSIGLNLQTAHFSSLQGANLAAGTFPTNAARLTGAARAFSVDTLSLALDSRSVTGSVSYGVTDRLAVAAAIPILHVRFSGRRERTVNGQTTLMSAHAGSTTGLGDVLVQGRYVLAGESARGVSVGTDARLPTGRAEDLRGSGHAALRLVGIGSWEAHQLALHGNAGVGVGGASREVFWSTATTFAATPRVSVIAEIMGRRLSALRLVQDVYEPHPLVAGVETMRWLPAGAGVHTLFVVTGAKWNPVSTWLVNPNVLIRVTDAGLRARVAPAVSLDYVFNP